MQQHSMGVLNHLVRFEFCIKCRQFLRLSGFTPKELFSKILCAKHDLGTIRIGRGDCFATGYRYLKSFEKVLERQGIRRQP